MLTAATRIAPSRAGVQAASLRQLTSAAVRPSVCGSCSWQTPSTKSGRELHTTPSTLAPIPEPSTTYSNGERREQRRFTSRKPPRFPKTTSPKKPSQPEDTERELSSLMPKPMGQVSVLLKDGKTELKMRYSKHLLLFANEGQDPKPLRANHLRDSCACSACRDPSSGQKSFATTEIPMDMEITNVKTTENGGLTVTVDRDMKRHGGAEGHEIHLSPDFLMGLCFHIGDPGRSKREMLRRFKRSYWDKQIMEKSVQKIDYEQFMKQDSKEFWDVISGLVEYGLVFLKNVPRDEHSIERITERIANIRETFYGRTFDVKAKPNAENVAYTSGYLGLHQDLLYLSPPPNVQILHCMDNSCKGGESLFSDADRIGKMLHMLKNSPPVRSLAKERIAYGYNRDGHYYGKYRYVLDLGPKSDFNRLFWSPPFQKELLAPMDLDMWTVGARVVESALNDPESVYETRMEPGDCALFDNLRVLHGRKAFDSEGGSRWLRGSYIAFEDFWSTAMHAPETHAKPIHRPLEWYDWNSSDPALRDTPAFMKIKEGLIEGQADVAKVRAHRSADKSYRVFREVSWAKRQEESN